MMMMSHHLAESVQSAGQVSWDQQPLISISNQQQLPNSGSSFSQYQPQQLGIASALALQPPILQTLQQPPADCASQLRTEFPSASVLATANDLRKTLLQVIPTDRLPSVEVVSTQEPDHPSAPEQAPPTQTGPPDPLPAVQQEHFEAQVWNPDDVCWELVTTDGTITATPPFEETFDRKTSEPEQRATIALCGSPLPYEQQHQQTGPPNLPLHPPPSLQDQQSSKTSHQTNRLPSASAGVASPSLQTGSLSQQPPPSLNNSLNNNNNNNNNNNGNSLSSNSLNALNNSLNANSNLSPISLVSPQTQLGGLNPSQQDQHPNLQSYLRQRPTQERQHHTQQHQPLQQHSAQRNMLRWHTPGQFARPLNERRVWTNSSSPPDVPLVREQAQHYHTLQQLQQIRLQMQPFPEQPGDLNGRSSRHFG